MKWLVPLLAMLVAVAPVMAAASGLTPLGPWAFGMTPAEVTSATAYGPYKSFSNGDLETYAGDFGGHKENVQFYFKDGKLVRMMVSRYEGTDVKEASRVFGDTYRILKSMYGAIETPDIQTNPPGQDVEPELVGIASGPQAMLTGKTQMAPIKQPANAFVFSSLAKMDVQGHDMYYVRVIYDPPHP